MSQQANNTLIGGFVITAIALAAAAIMVFGSGKFFETTTEYVMHFEGSVKGLSVGAPVMLKGVRVGSVKDIVLEFNPKTLKVDIPVFIEIEPQRFKPTGVPGPRNEEQRREQLKRMIELGLRGQLQAMSLVTGQLMVSLDFMPDAKVRLMDPDGPYPEIPTIPSAIEQVAETLKKIPLEEMIQKLAKVLDGLDRTVNGPDLASAMADLNQALKSVRQLAVNLDTQISPLAKDLRETVQDAQKVVRRVDAKIDPLADRLESVLAKADKEVEPLVDSIKKAADTAGLAMEQAEKTLAETTKMLGGNSEVKYSITKALQELAAAARSIRVWAEYMERHPEALLRGKD